MLRPYDSENYHDWDPNGGFRRGFLDSGLFSGYRFSGVYAVKAKKKASQKDLEFFTYIDT